MNRPLRDYTAYGLHVRSPVALPFTPLPQSPHGEPDVTIRIGKTPEALHLPIWRSRRRETAPGGVLLQNVDGVARYLVTGGRDVVVEPRGGSDNDLGVFLVTLVFAALLQQRDVVTLHASAVETGTGAVLFAGESGSGKSTLIAALVERGYAMLSDNLTGVVLAEDDRPTALSAHPGIRLRADALDALGWRPRAHGRGRDEKYLAPAARFRSAPQAVRAICLLEPWGRQDVAMEPVPVGGGAFKALWMATYQRRLVRQMKVQPEYFRTVTAVARRVPVFRVMRPAHPSPPTALADRIEEDLRKRASFAEKAPAEEHAAPLPASAAGRGSGNPLAHSPSREAEPGQSAPAAVADAKRWAGQTSMPSAERKERRPM